MARTQIRRSLTGALGRPGRRRSTLSVVVPVHDVAPYLEECLSSILGQRLGRGFDLEVVCVDDGSTDESPKILDRIAAADPRVRVLSQANAGLGAARNAGVAATTGDLLTFSDSDDVVPPGAYAALLASLVHSGSDLAVGRLERLVGDRHLVGPLMQQNHERARVATTVAQLPLLLADVFAVNKVYRRDFWVGNELAFPVGTRYEDQPTLTRTLLAARAVDVLTETVYLWRSREDGSSITQGRGRLEDLRDRIATKRDSTATVLAHGDETLLPSWFGKVLPVDMWEYFRAVPAATPAYWELLVSGVRELWNDQTLPFERTAVPVQQRLMGWFVGQDRRADLEALLEFIDAHPGSLPVSEVAGRRVFLHPWRDEPGLPESLTLVEPVGAHS